MDLGCPAAARTTDRLRLAPPFPPKAERLLRDNQGENSATI